jgi:hypothetical protein
LCNLICSDAMYIYFWSKCVVCFILTVVFWIILNYRFNDISASVRRICVQISQELIVNHQELVGDVAGMLME